MELGIKIVPCWMAIGLFFCMCMVSSYPSFMYPAVITSGQSMLAKHEYARFPEVEKECHDVISRASRLRRDRNRIESIRNELSFYYGDWEQDSGSSKALVPIPPHNSSARLYQLASFTVSDVEEDRRSSIIVKVFGSMTMQITDGKYYFDYGNYSSVNQFSTDNGPQFQFMTGSSSLTILFEGIYSEAVANGGERVLCLLGETSVPTSHTREPQGDWRTRRNQFAFLQDDRILMILRYPKSLSLTSRVIHGEMRSLHEQTDRRYFGKIRISSQLGSYSTYQFEAEDLFSKACTHYPSRDKMFSDQTTAYSPSQVCGSLNQFASGGFLIFPNWKCNSSRENCHQLGPFNSSQVVGRTNRTDGVFGRSTTLLIQDVRCEEQPTQGNAISIKVSAVFRAITEPIVVQRSSLDGMTLAAEGTWTSYYGQLCMVGCLGADGKRCNARILMYFSDSFSISHRYVMIGSISSANSDGVDSYHPLSFGRRVSTWELQSLDAAANISYKYTKIEKAIAFLENNKPSDFTARVKKSLLRFPKMEDGFEAFDRLANDLSFNSRIFSNPWSDARIGMEIFTIGSFFNHYRGMEFMEAAPIGVEEHMPAKTARTEGALLLNVSATLTVSEFNKDQFSNISELFLEGVYNPVDGKMYMIACRDARPSWNLSGIYDLENGMDCSIDVKIEYPPVTARWLVTEYVKITISSNRTDNDPIYFKKFELSTFPITYSIQREDMLSRENVEGVLQILTLSISIVCLFSQLFYLRKDASTVPYISIVMLGVLALGYSIPLIGGAGSLFFGRKSKSQRTFVNFQNYQSSHFIDYFVKILFLAAFLLTLRLVQKVWKSRNRLSSGVPSGSKLVPKEKWVFFTCLCLHVVGFLVVVNVNGVSKLNNTARMYLDTVRNSSLVYPVGDIGIHRSRQWGVELEEYVGMVQDFFLLPQVIGNFLWQLDGQPLRKTYYIGIAILRILPHVYDYARTPSSYPYEQAMPENGEFVNPDLDFYSKFGDIAIPIVASLLAAVVFCQQRWKCQKLYQLLGLDRFRVLFLRQRAYERLHAVQEAELVGINDIADRS